MAHARIYAQLMSEKKHDEEIQRDPKLNPICLHLSVSQLEWLLASGVVS